MRRRVILTVASVVAVALIMVFAVLHIHAPGELSTWEKIEIEYHYKRWSGEVLEPWEDEVDNLSRSAHVRYYGSDNGYLILHRHTYMAIGAEFEVRIGQYAFRHTGGQIFVLYAYKDGKFILLKNAYEQGLISDAGIEKAWNSHRQYPGCK